jgi:hypothetical protein
MMMNAMVSIALPPFPRKRGTVLPPKGEQSPLRGGDVCACDAGITALPLARERHRHVAPGGSRSVSAWGISSAAHKRRMRTEKMKMGMKAKQNHLPAPRGETHNKVV